MEIPIMLNDNEYKCVLALTGVTNSFGLSDLGKNQPDIIVKTIPGKGIIFIDLLN